MRSLIMGILWALMAACYAIVSIIYINKYFDKESNIDLFAAFCYLVCFILTHFLFKEKMKDVEV